jgi:hypothetical protein
MAALPRGAGDDTLFASGSLQTKASGFDGSLLASVSLDPLRVIVGQVIEFLFSAFLRTSPDAVRGAYTALIDVVRADPLTDALPPEVTIADLEPHMPAAGSNSELVDIIASRMEVNPTWPPGTVAGMVSAGWDHRTAHEQAKCTYDHLQALRAVAEKKRAIRANFPQEKRTALRNTDGALSLLNAVRLIVARGHATDIAYLARRPLIRSGSTTLAVVGREVCGDVDPVPRSLRKLIATCTPRLFVGLYERL